METMIIHDYQYFYGGYIMRKALGVLVLGLVASVAVFAGGSGDQSKTLVFWDMPWGGAEYTAEARALCERYTAETGQPVEYRQIPWEGWVQVFVTAVTSNTGPDVGTGGAFLQHRLALMNEVEIIDDLVASWSENDFVPGTLRNFRHNGNQIAIPINCDFRAIAYRTDLFRADGITKLPSNWAEFYESAKKLTHGDQYGFVQAGTGGDANWNMLFWAVMNGAAYLDDNMNPCMATSANVEAMDYLRRLYNEKIMPPGVPGYTGDEHLRLFYQGKAAMVMCTPGIGQDMGPEVLANIAILPPMTSPAGLKQNIGSTNGMMLLKDSRLKAEGKKFIEWWSKNTVTLWSKGHAGPFPARLSLIKDPWFQDNSVKRQFSDLILPATVQLSYPHPEASVEMDIMDGEWYYVPAVQQALTTKDDTLAVLKAADTRYLRALEQLRRGAN
jgi:multiple sugar transport system substrate-binding protein